MRRKTKLFSRTPIKKPEFKLLNFLNGGQLVWPPLTLTPGSFCCTNPRPQIYESNYLGPIFSQKLAKKLIKYLESHQL